MKRHGRISNRWVRVDDTAERITESAVMIAAQQWIPRSVILRGDEVSEGDGPLFVKRWFAEQEGIDVEDVLWDDVFEFAHAASSPQLHAVTGRRKPTAGEKPDDTPPDKRAA